jgi:hypothetical protein
MARTASGPARGWRVPGAPVERKAGVALHTQEEAGAVVPPPPSQTAASVRPSCVVGLFRLDFPDRPAS